MNIVVLKCNNTIHHIFPSHSFLLLYVAFDYYTCYKYTIFLPVMWIWQQYQTKDIHFALILWFIQYNVYFKLYFSIIWNAILWLLYRLCWKLFLVMDIDSPLALQNNQLGIASKERAFLVTLSILCYHNSGYIGKI